MKRITWLVILFSIFSNAWAVQQNHNGKGEVLIYPYYTINNDLNTLYSVINTTADPKAIKLRFLEADISRVVLTFNVYLDAFDVWTGALVSTVSTIPGHVGEPSVLHVTGDTSCAPFLIKAGQEFLPYELDTDLNADNRSLQRATEGHLEIIEMGVLTGEAVSWVSHGLVGVPACCNCIQEDWTDNTWNSGELNNASGGLIGSGSIINVAEGIDFPFDTITLQDFWQGSEVHTEPGSLIPDLNSAFPESNVMLENGGMAVSSWDNGYQAVSAVLTHSQIFNEYSLEQFLDSKTEWVVTFPTKNFHSSGDEAVSPFNSIWDGENACETVEWNIWDRESLTQNLPVCIGSPCPPRPFFPSLCKSINVLDFYLPSGTPLNPTAVLGSNNRLSVFIHLDGWTESGWSTLSFPDTAPSIPNEGDALLGLPVTGFAVMQYTNAGAAEGLLAQYGALFKHKYTVETAPQ